MLRRFRPPSFSVLIAWPLVIGLLAACTLTGGPETGTSTPPTSAPALIPSAMPGDAAPRIVAWVDNGDLFTWTSANPMPRRIASGGVIRPALAPDGARVAYLRGPGGDPRSLWISDTPGAAERQAVDATTLPGGDPTRRIHEMVWARDGQAVYFNTFTGDGMEARPADDLWRVAVAGGNAERLLDDGLGGHLTLSPDGTLLALASAGSYAQPGESGGVSAQIALFTLATSERRILVEYPAVATASQSRWYPDLRWLPDSSGLRMAVPEPELVYGEGETVLWALPVEGDAAELGTVEADFFGLPVFSADGAWIAYLERRAALDQPDLTLLLARSDGSAPETIAHDQVGALTRPVWLPGAALFTYVQGAAGETWLGGPGIDPLRFPSEIWTISDLLWIDSHTALFSAEQSGSFGLYLAQRDGPAPADPLATAQGYPFFDAVQP